jgi:hypothetical protein
MSETNPLIKDLVAEYLGSPIKLLRAQSGSKIEVIFYAKERRHSPFVAFVEFSDALLANEAHLEDLPTLLKAFDRAVRLSVQGPLLVDLLESANAFAIWVENQWAKNSRCS